jgi:DNA primase large subunit
LNVLTLAAMQAFVDIATLEVPQNTSQKDRRAVLQVQRDLVNTGTDLGGVLAHSSKQAAEVVSFLKDAVELVDYLKSNEITAKELLFQLQFLHRTTTTNQKKCVLIEQELDEVQRKAAASLKELDVIGCRLQQEQLDHRSAADRAKATSKDATAFGEQQPAMTARG